MPSGSGSDREPEPTGAPGPIDPASLRRWRGFGLPPPRNRRAYVFYATDHSYAIAVVVFARLLQRLGLSGDADLIVLHLAVPRYVIATMRDMGMVTTVVPALGHVDHPYFRHCLVKLRVFQLIEYERILFADADAIPLKSLDPLFDLAEDRPVTAATAYWMPQPCWTSALFLARPSVVPWQRLRRHVAAAAERRFFDMDILNAEFGTEIGSLPAGWFCLNSEWEDSRQPCVFGDPEEAYARAAVVHFTALGKPWSFPLAWVRRARPNAHPIFYELWERWRRARDEIW
jgi:hypothetical protein